MLPIAVKAHGPCWQRDKNLSAGEPEKFRAASRPDGDRELCHSAAGHPVAYDALGHVAVGVHRPVAGFVDFKVVLPTWYASAG